MKAVVVSHGEIKDYLLLKDILKSSDLIVCADGGAEYVVACSMLPHALIGDLDSIDDAVLEKLKETKCDIIKYPREKDYTDTQLAVDYAVDKGADEIILLGSTGDRLDHSLANILLLVKLTKSGIRASVIDEKNTIDIMDRYLRLKGSRGDLISLIPVGGDVCGIYTQGLKYRLCGSDIALGDPLGISNVFEEEEIEIRIDSGLMLVIRSRD